MRATENEIAKSATPDPANDARPGSHALVARTMAAAAQHDRSFERPASFLAHLITAKAQLPQTRERRRAEPDEAVHGYEAALATKPDAAGRNYSRAT